MIDAIQIPSSLSIALQKRMIEKNGFAALLRFALSTHHPYLIPEEKVNELYSLYMQSLAEYYILQAKVTEFFPEGVPKDASWDINFYTNLLSIKDYTTKEEQAIVRRFKDDSYDDILHRIYDEEYPNQKIIEVTFQVTEACSLACKYCLSPYLNFFGPYNGSPTRG